ncbi:MAG: hypothetical protein EFKGCFLK_00041 [Rhodocyclaceae bacterium]|nr:hypothetical protein [Rhodocyclaceae bacterium]CAG0930171.1 hypothetical protein RHDC3_01411 [Rhodocyclaceae bacterium]
MRRILWGTFLAWFSMAAWGAAEVGLVTAVAGGIKLQDEKKAESDLKSFIKLRPGDRLKMDGTARLQLVYFDGGRQETWQGAGQLEVGAKSSSVVQGGLRPEVKVLPPILVKQLSKTPSADENVKAGMIRMRSMPAGVTIDSIEQNYAGLREKAEASDRNPELYLLSGYFELREFGRVEKLLGQMGEKSPDDPEIRMLKALYARAISNARMANR